MRTCVCMGGERSKFSISRGHTLLVLQEKKVSGWRAASPRVSLVRVRFHTIHSWTDRYSLEESPSFPDDDDDTISLLSASLLPPLSTVFCSSQRHFEYSRQPIALPSRPYPSSSLASFIGLYMDSFSLRRSPTRGRSTFFAFLGAF